MQVHHLIEAHESLEHALQCTPAPTEREEIKQAINQVVNILRKRGVFVGEQDERSNFMRGLTEGNVLNLERQLKPSP